jgi:RNA polymerase sigma-70 factor, ECF subfamily
LPERTTDALLLEKAANGDPAAFKDLYERHRLPVFRFAYRLLGSVEGAEDVTHDCFLSLIRRPDGFDEGRASLRTYLFSAARNLALKHFRKLGRETSLEDAEDDERSGEVPQPIKRLLREEMEAQVKAAILALPPLQREALVLFEYEGLALDDIARITNSEVGAIKSRLHRARERLKRDLRPYLRNNRELNTSREIVTLKEA